ncbi:MAG TPA: zinc ABC transporter substrate-binding protein [Candidatus Hydrogenedens sp.]|nr:zinc ABC transporter substrate-binding protein [Candidatus Hydrogenedens sp.]HOL18760.1 zinc ABC transporter substrate-binding protein [Candidatus Hydrogenedens sp.]HPP59090.1 zinc ABC transporter substrate-binding protein [Candidatus Hydrogenedens sp.]
MKMRLYTCIFFALVFNLFSPFCLWAIEEGNVYYAGIPPVAGILDRLILPQEQVQVICASNVNPHTFDISPSQLQKLTHAKAFFHTNFPYELKIVKTLETTKNNVQCVDVTQNVHWREERIHSHYEHRLSQQYGGNNDLHCWLSPENLKIMSFTIYSTLVRNNPEKKDVYQVNYKKWLSDLEEIDKKIKEILLPHKGKRFFVYHPAFGYFAESYGLHEVYIEMEGKTPSPKQMQTLFEQMKREGTRVIFIQPQFDPKPAEIIANAIGGRVEVMNDFERDVLNQFLFIAEKISDSYK